LLGPLEWYSGRGFDSTVLKELDDVSKEMGVTKSIAEDEAMQYGAGAGGGKQVVSTPFPHFVPKTDATRLQHYPDEFFDAIRGKSVVITRKEDGCSCTFVARDGEFLICGRNFVFDSPNAGVQHYFDIEAKFGIRDKMLSLGRNLAIQGEIIGPKINGNRLRRVDRSFAVFDIFDIDAQEYVVFAEMCQLCSQLGLATVPVLYQGPVSSLGFGLTIEDFLSFAEGVEYAPGVGAEGVVVKLDDDQDITAHAPPGVAPTADQEEEHGHQQCQKRLTFKVISNKYLMKHNL
jgi:RNA ligase (TIGR02306 family)